MTKQNLSQEMTKLNLSQEMTKLNLSQLIWREIHSVAIQVYMTEAVVVCIVPCSTKLNLSPKMTKQNLQKFMKLLEFHE